MLTIGWDGLPLQFGTNIGCKEDSGRYYKEPGRKKKKKKSMARSILCCTGEPENLHNFVMDSINGDDASSLGKSRRAASTIGASSIAASSTTGLSPRSMATDVQTDPHRPLDVLADAQHGLALFGIKRAQAVTTGKRCIGGSAPGRLGSLPDGCARLLPYLHSEAPCKGCSADMTMVFSDAEQLSYAAALFSADTPKRPCNSCNLEDAFEPLGVMLECGTCGRQVCAGCCQNEIMQNAAEHAMKACREESNNDLQRSLTASNDYATQCLHIQQSAEMLQELVATAKQRCEQREMQLRDERNFLECADDEARLQLTADLARAGVDLRAASSALLCTKAKQKQAARDLRTLDDVRISISEAKARARTLEMQARLKAKYDEAARHQEETIHALEGQLRQLRVSLNQANVELTAAFACSIAVPAAVMMAELAVEQDVAKRQVTEEAQTTGIKDFGREDTVAEKGGSFDKFMVACSDRFDQATDPYEQANDLDQVQVVGTNGQCFLVDNRDLQAATQGLHYRMSKQMKDKAPKHQLAKWGCHARGTISDCGGWLLVGERWGPRYLPFTLQGNTVLKPAVPSACSTESLEFPASTPAGLWRRIQPIISDGGVALAQGPAAFMVPPVAEQQALILEAQDACRAEIQAMQADLASRQRETARLQEEVFAQRAGREREARRFEQHAALAHQAQELRVQLTQHLQLRRAALARRRDQALAAAAEAARPFQDEEWPSAAELTPPDSTS